MKIFPETIIKTCRECPESAIERIKGGGPVRIRPFCQKRELTIIDPDSILKECPLEDYKEPIVLPKRHTISGTNKFDEIVSLEDPNGQWIFDPSHSIKIKEKK